VADCVLILAGGKGTRMKSELPKPMFEILGEPILEWILSSCEDAKLRDVCVVKGFSAEVIERYLENRNKVSDVSYQTVLQAERMGTGHAVMMARDFLKTRISESEPANVLILCGDAPFIDTETIERSAEKHKSSGNAVTVITANVSKPRGYGRIVRRKDGHILGIVEEKDLTNAQKNISEINSGAMWFDIKALLFALDEIKPNNAQNEYYLTDSIHILSQAGYKTGTFISDNERVVMGANDRKGMLVLNNIARQEIIEKHLDNGVEFTCTDGVEIGRKVVIENGVKIRQGAVLRGNTAIGKNTEIGVNCLIENCTVGEKCTLNSVQAYDSVIEDNVLMGPFVRIRPGSVIKSGVKIGNFVEVKNSTVGEKTAIAHLTYVGDSDVGKNVNFGCGVVTVNYDGNEKFRTTIGDDAFIGCNTNLVAPVKVGKRGYTAAGSTVTEDIPDGALGIERGQLHIKEGYSEKKLKK
jgi:bifunctional UDP-N-acetylglucosamine pyrophosphorylase/glucosamine-1-phosphate N-acetyltransferase